MINSSGGDGGILLTDIYGTGTTGTVVQGNYVGLATNGTTVLSTNNGLGIYLTTDVGQNVSNNTIGGTIPEAANVIGGWATGITLAGAGVQNNSILGNYIGTDLDEQLNFGNSAGIQVANTSTNTIGGLGAGQANVIAFSQGAGIALPDSIAASSSIRGNRVYNNRGLAIDVGPTGPTPNGTVGFRDKPVFTSANISGGNLVLTGTSQSNALIDLFASNATFDGFGKAQNFSLASPKAWQQVQLRTPTRPLARSLSRFR